VFTAPELISDEFAKANEFIAVFVAVRTVAIEEK
jgi:hypothetical protein